MSRPKIGRPPINEDVGRGKPTKIARTLYEQCQARAKASFRSVCGEVNHLLQFALNNIEKIDDEKGGGHDG